METFIDISTGETFVENLDSMARLNSTFAVKTGAVGSVLKFKLFDENKLPFSLAGGVLTVSARKGRSKTDVDELLCTPNINQFDFPGIGTFTFDDDASSIRRGTYNLEFKFTNSSTGAVSYFPNKKGIPFATLVVEEPLS